MAHRSYYRCPDCAGKFSFLHHPDDEPPPDRCPLCGAWVSDNEPVFEPQAPGIRKSVYAKSVDQVYRAMETSSAERAEAMAELAGGSAADYSHTKITNLRDPTEMREGDTAAILPPISRETQEVMAATPNITGWQPPTAQSFAEASRIGPYAGAGDGMRQKLVAQHHSQLRDIVGGGMLGAADKDGNLRG